ncbi:hypothetical protein ACTXM8_17100 [Brachybacterium alimentarium]|uniref:hypothetical protein n=1 Tax=Brachybacterium alimentarium TaxID=47845 RepID=UPI003FCF421E
MTTVTTTPPPITLAAARGSVRAATALHEAAHVAARAHLGLETIGVAVHHDDADGLAAADALAEVIVPRMVVDRRDLAVDAMAGQSIEAMLEAGVDTPAHALAVAVDLAARIDLLPRTPGDDLAVAGRLARPSAPHALALLTTHWDAVTAIAGVIAAGGAWTPWEALAPHAPAPDPLALDSELLEAWDDLLEQVAAEGILPPWPWL